jgi:hypothetical protein
MSNVYFLVMRTSADPGHDFGFVKVGITDGDVADRIASLQTGNPHELRCIHSFETSCAREVEHFMHRTHAADMHNREWLRCPAGEVSDLFEKAKEAAVRFENRKSKEDTFRRSASNGKERRAEPEEIRLHREVRKLAETVVPERLRLEAAESELKAATGGTYGIHGIVRVKYVQATIRFSSQLAETAFPELAARCRVRTMKGKFHWRRLPMRSRFAEGNLSAKEAAARAQASATATLAANIGLEGWVEPTPEMKRLHGDFLEATQTVNRIEADLADLQSEFVIRLGEYDVLDPVCSFKRSPALEIDSAAFCKAYPREAAQCAEPVAPQLRKHVYPTRSYI